MKQTAIEKATAMMGNLTQKRKERIASAEATIQAARAIEQETTKAMKDAIENGDEAGYVAASMKNTEAKARADFAEKTLEQLRTQPLVKGSESRDLLSDLYKETLTAYQEQTKRVIDAWAELITAEEKAAAIVNGYHEFCQGWKNEIKDADGNVLPYFPYNSAHFDLQRHRNSLAALKDAAYMKG